ncbi:helix-turn-helix domain-containing protein [Jiulongibacter sp. NS-SX5]|uniref:helix-turn-helix domain-containing protein n=1 Tax=Jiulongibacter sp. NS-SX5 TaxID=3463854 RepID=UPI00405A307C
MKIIVNLDIEMAKKRMSLNELSEKVGVSNVNLSILKNQKAKGVRFETLLKICEALDCTPGDIIAIEK